MPEGKRRLAAIMFTDIVGYTALGQRNEDLSLALVDAQRRLVRPTLARHNGREVKTIGDAFLVEFPSALDAVRCAYDIQRTIREYNLSLASDKRVHLRIGVHLGEVLESQGDISGDAVNVASRIESLAEDGGACLTRQVYDHVKNKVELDMTSLGPKSLKNVAEPVEVFKVVMPWETGAVASGPRLDPKRLAVMPFVNMSTDPGDAYLADGLTEELISTISNIQELVVISRTSIMKYKGGSATVGEIGQALRVGSIVEGSVRKSANRIRISAQLIDANTDGHLWARIYDRDIGDIFSIQSEIAQQVAEALKIQLLAKEREGMEKRATDSTEAYELYLKGRHHWNERTREGLDRAVNYFQDSLTKDPKYALAFAGLADCYIIYADYNWMKPREAFPKAYEYAVRSIEINPRLAEPHASLGLVHSTYEWNWSKAEEEFKKAVDLNPSYVLAYMWYALFLMAMLRFEEGYEVLDKAGQLDPLSRLVQVNRGATLMYMGRPKEAVEIFKEVVRDAPNFGLAHTSLGQALLADSRNEEAIEEARKGLALWGGDLATKAEVATTLGVAGRREEAEVLLKELLDAARTSWLSSVKIAQVLFSVGRTDEAFTYLDKSIEEKSTFLSHGGVLTDLRVLPWYREIRSDPKWSTFLGKIGAAKTSGS